MNISRKIALTGVVTLGVFALGSAGAAAVAHALTIEDRTGAVQNLAPVTTGTITPLPAASPFDDTSIHPTGTTTVAPADPVNVDQDGDVPHSGADARASHVVANEASREVNGDGAGRDTGDNTSGSGIPAGTTSSSRPGPVRGMGLL